MNLSIIIINWNSSDLLCSCLHSIRDNPPKNDFEVMVVDNASTDTSVTCIKDRYPWVTLIENKDNLGFARANNQGVRISQGENILFLNPDTIVLQGSLDTMVASLRMGQGRAIVGPKLCANNNNECVPFITKYMSPARVLLMHLPLYALLSSVYFKIAFDLRKTRDVDFVSGAALLAKREVLQEIGLFDEHFFMYFEDQDLCLRAKRQGYRICFSPEARIIHFGGGCTKPSVSKKFDYLLESQRYFLHKHYSPRVVAFFGVLLRWLIGLKRALKIFPQDEYNRKLLRSLTLK